MSPSMKKVSPMSLLPDPFTRAVAAAGSENRLAKLTNYSQHAIWYARRHNKVTAEMALRIERATGVPAAEFRPDLFDHQDRGMGGA